MGNLSTFVKRVRDIMRNDAGINGAAQRIEQIAWMLFLKVYDAKELDWEFDDEGYTSIIPGNCRWRSWAADDRTGRAMTGDNLLDFVNNTLFPTLKGLEVTPETPVKKAVAKKAPAKKAVKKAPAKKAPAKKAPAKKAAKKAK